MDKGAHFFKCDFQVHTPRDIGWIGNDSVLTEERKAYSEALVRSCRQKDISSIAVTDHHDFVFYPFVKQAAAAELNDDGEVIPSNQQLVVFPGLELTLASPPCQALLLLDSSFPDNMLQGVLTALAITPSSEQDSKASAVVPIPQAVAGNFKELYERLNGLDYIKNRFIVFPHVSDGGHRTLLRSGFADYYKSMPCVGGYLDGPVTRMGRGNTDITNGNDRNYGFKSIALIQTSDNRKETHDDLGKYCTWIKWAEPSAEALRQACLAKNSRIAHDIPILPPIFITSIDVSNSKFLGRIYLELNQQYNAIIGGRGTGKSTILEYIRWGLCDQSPNLSTDDNDLPNYQERRKKLIEKTLLPFDATIQVAFTKNDIPHVVRRKANSNEMLLKIGNDEFEPCTEDNIRDLLPIQAYSQKQLSSVGVSQAELKRLIYSPIRQALVEYDLNFKNLQTDIRACYENRLQRKLLEADLERHELELKSITEQAEKLRKELKGISDEDKATINSHEQFAVFEQLVDGWVNELASANESIDGIITKLAKLPSPLPSDSTPPEEQKEIVLKINEYINDVFNTLRADLEKIKTSLTPNSSELVEFNKSKNSWLKQLDQHKKNYNSAKEKSSSQSVTLDQIKKLEERSKEVRKSVNEKKQLLLKLEDPEQKFSLLTTKWIDAHKERADLLDSQCKQLCVLSDDNLRASLGRGKGVSELQSTFKSILVGANVRKEKLELIYTAVTNAPEPIQVWQELLKEFELLSVFDIDNQPSERLPATPKLTGIGFTPKDLIKMAEKVSPTNFIDLYLVQLDDIPVFEYKTRDGEYIDFEDASAGQQATSLIHVLLNQDGPPLIIDQPEDDLDNQMVSEIATLICKSKKNRQLLFTSHNANIVVNGDAELVICCDYTVSGDQSKGEIKNEGAIDISDIRDEITKVMEGGEKAFMLRKEKYGF